MEILRKKTKDVYPGLKVTSYCKAKTAVDVYAYEWCDCGPPECHYGCDCGSPSDPGYSELFSTNHEATWVSSFSAEYAIQQQ